MKIKSNTALRYVVPVIALVLMVLGVRACQQTDVAQEQAANDAKTVPQLTQEQMRALGIEAESPEDTVATLVAEMYRMQRQLKETKQASTQLRKQNRQLAEENEQLHGNLQHAINTALAEQSSRYQDRHQSLLDTLSKRFERLRVSLDLNSGANPDQQAGNDMPIGLGLNGETPAGAQGGLVWVNPLSMKATATDESAAAGGASAFDTAFDAGRGAVASAGRTVAGTMPGGLASGDIRGATASGRAAATTPVYTVPKNSTLAGSVSMTALLGRVPIDGTVQNPYPFKIVIGGENLVANGIMLPELKGAIVSGTAIGDWTLSCVRGTVRSITFVFQDGTVRTVPKSDKPGEGGNNNSNKNEGIGYISNPAGLPCVPGTRKTNARKFILTQMILSTGAAAAGAVAGGETTSSVSPFGSTTTVTGDIGRYIAGQALAEGINATRKWVQERFGQTFDAVYVPPGQAVVVNITKTLPIDYQHNGRKVNYVQNTRTQGLD